MQNYLQKKFTVAPSDWSSLTTWLDGIGVGQPFSTDANGKQYYYLSYDNATYKVTYSIFVGTTEDLTTSDTLNGGIAIASLLEESPPTSPQPQYRFYDNQGLMNPDYETRVGSVFTIEKPAGKDIRIIKTGYTTSLKSDFVSLELDSYEDAEGVVGHDDAGNPNLVFTPTYTGVFHYITVDLSLIHI